MGAGVAYVTDQPHGKRMFRRKMNLDRFLIGQGFLNQYCGALTELQADAPAFVQQDLI